MRTTFILRLFILTFVLIPFRGKSQSEFLLQNRGATISYKVYGNGSPLLLINGGPGYSSEHLNEVALRISEKFKVILFDQRGTGKSKVKQYDSATINLKNTLSDIDAIREKLNLKSWIVSGQSFGGLLAMAYAEAYADRVDQLVLISSAGLDLSFISTFQANVINVIGKDTSLYTMPDSTSAKDFFLNMVRVNAPAYVFDKSKTEIIRNVLGDKDQFTVEVNGFMWMDLFQQNFDLADKLKKFKKRTLILQGEQDIVGMNTAYKIHAAIPNSKIHFIPRCGHVPWLDQPSLFYTALFNFLSKSKT